MNGKSHISHQFFSVYILSIFNTFFFVRSFVHSDGIWKGRKASNVFLSHTNAATQLIYSTNEILLKRVHRTIAFCQLVCEILLHIQHFAEQMVAMLFLVINTNPAWAHVKVFTVFFCLHIYIFLKINNEKKKQWVNMAKKNFHSEFSFFQSLSQTCQPKNLHHWIDFR